MRYFVLAIICIFNLKLIAQENSANILFEKEKHDFGIIHEEKGSVSYEFEFKNIGSEPLIISKVNASCGCTTPEWPKEPILPNKKGVIKAKYDPNNRPGPFNKTITVVSNAIQTNKILIISGEVIPRTKNTLDFFPQSIDSLKFRTTHMAFLKTYNDEVRTDTMSIYNPTNNEYKIEFDNPHKHIKINANPSIIKPSSFSVITVTYDAKMKKDWGFVMDRIDIIIDGIKKPNNKFTVSADIQENFDALSDKEKQNAPKIEFETKEYNFGTIKHGESSSFEFKFKNSGNSNLIIHKTNASCGCTAIAPEKNIIKAGESSSFKVKFNSTGKHGHQVKTVTVITNDPNNSTLILKIVGDIID